jgi:hypothetical protein
MQHLKAEFKNAFLPSQSGLLFSMFFFEKKEIIKISISGTEFSFDFSATV